MLKKFFSFCLLLSLSISGISLFAKTPTPHQGVVRVKLQSEVSSTVMKARATKAKDGAPLRLGVAELDKSLAKINGISIRKLFPCHPSREAAHREFGLDLWYEITFDESVNPLEAQRVLRATPGVQSATAKVPMMLYDDGVYTQVGSAPRREITEMPFNDPRLSQQWHYTNDGSKNGSVAGADINLFEAWKITSGLDKVVVAIIDGGIDYTHEDLADAMYVNEVELYGQEGVDDDGDGYIDNIYGYNFCTNSGVIYPHDHGTHVAGTVGAVNNNGVGVCGVAGGNGTKGSGVRLMSVQVFDPRSGSGNADFAAALIYAADHGATIAQCSWGWDFEGYYEEDVHDAIKYFTRTARSNNMIGGICIFAAGNEGTEGLFYPAAWEENIAVAAMGCDMLPPNYTNYGDWVDITAPGGLVDFDTTQGVLSTLPGDKYGFNHGTSMAAPHVSGIAALVLSKYGSPTMVNETLRQQLLTSVNDLYAYVPQGAGKFGSGYIDAWKALQWSDGTAPESVSDLTVDASQDNATLTWTLPASSDNNVTTCVIYYSDSAFDEQSLSQCRSEVVDTKFYTSGQRCSHEIEGLKAMTTYYFAIKALNRWSNASALSPIVTATTNAGPTMKLSRTAMNIRCTGGNTWTSSDFTISNVGEGLLKWSADLRTFESNISAHSARQSLGLIGTVPFSGKVGIEPYQVGSSTVERDIEDYVAEDYPRSFTNAEILQAFIGDNETTNSMAQLFVVDPNEYPDGFNLTHIQMMGSYGINPTIEIYRNTGTLAQSALLERMSYNSTLPYYSDIPLNESLFFAPGQSFYVVVHFREFQNRNYPLGLGLSNGNKAAAQAYMSTDLGETWTLLSAVLRGTAYEEFIDRATWAITVRSKYPDWSRVLTLEPASGQIRGGDQATVTVKHNGTRIPNGSYRARLHFDTNETVPSGKTINININVEGNQPEVSFNKIVQFGNILVGQSKTITIEVTNRGYGAFYGTYSEQITSSSPHFHGPSQLPYGIGARTTVQIELTYEPREAGSHSGVITFMDAEGRSFRVNVQGAATDPAHLVITPEVNEVGNLIDGAEPTAVDFTISNDGNYPLQYVMPKFTDQTLEEVSSGDLHRFGYNWVSNLYGAQGASYPGRPELLNPTDVASQFADYTYFTEPIDIGFEFPFYDKTYEQIYISSFGTLSFDRYLEGLIYSPLSETRTSYLMGLGVISAYGFEGTTSPTTKVEYARQDGKFVVSYTDILVPVYDKEVTPVSFSIALSPTGDIEIYYHDYVPERVFQEGSPLWLGIVDPDMEDPLTVTSPNMSSDNYFNFDESEPANRWRYIRTGSAFIFKAPRPDMIVSVEPAWGIVAPGETVPVRAMVKATEQMYAGPTSTDLVVLSNSLLNPTAFVTFNANITGDLKPKLDLSSDAVDFGKVFRTSNARYALTVHNHGRNTMTLQGVEIAGGRFSHDFTSPMSIPAGQSKDVVITMPTSTEGTVEDMLTVTTDAGTRNVPIRGEVIGVPTATLGYTSLTETVASGQTVARPLTITNNGNETLEYSVVAGPYTSYSPAYESGSSTSYIFKSSSDDPSAAHEWVDIETNGLGTQHNYTYYLNHDYVTVDLPFEFPFYGRKYSKLYLYNAGFVSFTERHDDAIWPEPPVDFPAGTVYNNLIAPYWGLHTMDMSSTAGTFYYVSEDRAVISYIEYGNSMNLGVDFQVVLNKDGSFYFNYKAAYENAIIFAPFGVAGLSDNDGVNGINLPTRLIQFGNSVDFKPVVLSTLAPGQSTVADVKVVASDLAGSYKGSLTVNSNVPGSECVEVPVNLTITGSPVPVFPEDIVMENVAEYRNPDYTDPVVAGLGAMWYAPIEICNEGTAAFTIKKVDFTSPVMQGMKLFTLYYYGDVVDTETHQTRKGWTAYPTGKSITVGREPARFVVPFTILDASSYAWQIPGEYDVKLTIQLTGLGDMTSKEINVKLIVTDKPAITFSRDRISVEGVADDYVGVETFSIANTEGQYKLKYSLVVDPTGVGESTEDFDFDYVPSKAPAQKLEAPKEPGIPAIARVDASTLDYTPHRMVGKDENYLNTPQADDFEYNRAMYWPASTTSNTAWVYGTGSKYGVYKAATAYTGPAGGFNISHIYSLIHPYALDNTDIRIDIVNGDPQKSAEVIGTGTYHIGKVQSGLYDTAAFILRLDHPVYISEGQQFYVVTTFPTGQESPAALIKKEESVVSNRYLGYWDTFGWFDVAAVFESGYGSLGYVQTCIETFEGDAWVKVLDSDGHVTNTLEGEVAPGASVEIPVQLSAAMAPMETENRAVLIIKSNDPANSVVNYPVTLSKNRRPFVTGSKGALTVEPDQTITTSFTAVDPEGEDMTVSIISSYDYVSIISAEPIEGDGDIIISARGSTIKASNCPSGIKVQISIRTTVLSSGDQTITITATDATGHEGEGIISYSVASGNHAPVAIEFAPITVPLGGASDVISMKSLFNDPDGDELTYDLRFSKTGYLTAFVNGDRLIFSGDRLGELSVIVTATDPEGLSATNSLTVVIEDRAGIDDLLALESEILTYPNPATEAIFVATSVSGSTKTEVISLTGATVISETYEAQAETAHRIEIGTLPAAPYLLRVTLPDTRSLTRVFIVTKE